MIIKGIMWIFYELPHPHLSFKLVRNYWPSSNRYLSFILRQLIICFFLICMLAIVTVGCSPMNKPDSEAVRSSNKKIFSLPDSIDLRLSMNSDQFRVHLEQVDSTQEIYDLLNIFLLPASDQFPSDYPTDSIYIRFTEGQQVLFDILALQTYIDRKGIAQYLWASSMDQISNTSIALRIIQMDQLASGLGEVKAQWDINSAAYFYWIQTRDFEEISKRMDIQWYQELYNAQSGNLLRNSLIYMRENREDFITKK